MIEYLNMLTAAIALLAAGFMYARIQIRMRALSSGALLAFGILKLHATAPGIEVVHIIVDLAIICCLVYFAVVANNFVELSAKVAKVKSLRSTKDGPDPITDFPPHDYNKLIDEVQNVIRK